MQQRIIADKRTFKNELFFVDIARKDNKTSIMSERERENYCIFKKHSNLIFSHSFRRS